MAATEKNRPLTSREIGPFACKKGRKKGNILGLLSLASGLYRAQQFFGEHLGFLGQVAGQPPVARARSFTRSFAEPLALGNQLGLCRVQPLSARGREILLGAVRALVGLLLRGGNFGLRELRS